jgi:bifunctional NMN adenylyltransferase/nudix hydrolase
MKVGLIIGRFQPLHNGHVSLIERSLEENDKTIVVVGSINKLPDFKNPFTAEERIQFIRDRFEGLIIVPMKDCPTDDEWESNVIALVNNIEENPANVTLYTNPKDEQWYREHLVYPVKVLDDVNISATQIRHAWYTNSLWTVESLLPDGIQKYLEEHHDVVRLIDEYHGTMESMKAKEEGHPFGNPMEPVSFAVIVQGDKLLVGKRKGFRGKGQLGLLGGYLQNTETTLDGCMREVLEESDVDLASLLATGRAKCITRAIEENIDDIGTRTLGVNYLFVIHPEEELELNPDGEETESLEWVDLTDVLHEKTLLFFNHNLITQRLLSIAGGAKE